MSAIDSIISSISSYFYPEEVPCIEAVSPQSSIVYDTVKPSQEVLRSEWTPERPRLMAPSQLPQNQSLSEYRLLAVTNDTRALGDDILETLSFRLQSVKEKIREVSAENMGKLREAATRASSSDFWGILKKIATSLVSAISAVFGIAILATGGSALVGGAMIASGVLSLANFALSELGTWDWIADLIAHNNDDLKKKLQWILPGAVGILAAGIGIVGSVNGVVSGAMNFAEKAASVAQTGIAIFQSVTTIGKSAADANTLWTKADLKMIQAHLTVERENFTSTIDEIKGSMSEFKGVNTKTKKAIEMIAQSNIELVRQA